MRLHSPHFYNGVFGIATRERSVTYCDDFDRADEALEDDENWIVPLGSFAISGGTASASASGDTDSASTAAYVE